MIVAGLSLLAALGAAGASLGANDAKAEAFWAHFVRVSEVHGGDNANLLLITLDANGDGRPEIFLAQSEKCGNGGCPWYVYSPTTTPAILRYLGEAGFHSSGYRFENRTITSCWHMSAAECAWEQQKFRGYRMTRPRGRTCGRGPGAADPQWCKKELEAIRAWQHDSAPPLYWTTMPAPEGWPFADKLAWHRKWHGKSEPASDGEVPTFKDLFVIKAGQ